MVTFHCSLLFWDKTWKTDFFFFSPCVPDLWRSNLCRKDREQVPALPWWQLNLSGTSFFFWLQKSGLSPHVIVIPPCLSWLRWAVSGVGWQQEQTKRVGTVDLPLLCMARVGSGWFPGKMRLKEALFVTVLVMGRKILDSAFGGGVHQLLCQRAWLVCCK